jgi:opacity protein-like surface antigen
MKKLSSALLLICAQAASAAHPFQGYYLALGAGGTLEQLSNESAVSANAPGIYINIPGNIDVQDLSGTTLLGAGYSHHFANHWVVGGEIIAEVIGAETSHRSEIVIFGTLVESKFESKLYNDFALLFKAGYVIHEKSQLYALLGPRWGSFETQLHTHAAIGDTNDRTRSYETGVTAGLGLEHLITDHLSIGLEYDYTYYGEIKSPSNAFVINTGLTVPIIDKHEITARTQSMMASLKYYF